MCRRYEMADGLETGQNTKICCANLCVRQIQGNGKQDYPLPIEQPSCLDAGDLRELEHICLQKRNEIVRRIDQWAKLRSPRASLARHDKSIYRFDIAPGNLLPKAVTQLQMSEKNNRA